VKKLYVGNLPWSTTEDQLKAMFADHGDVEDAKIITDRETGRSRGFAFVTMASEDGASKAIANLNDKEFSGRKMLVNEARERDRNDSNRNGGGYSGGGSGYSSGGSRGNGGGGRYQDRQYN
jgi:cold-inducible RNA-binding protein